MTTFWNDACTGTDGHNPVTDSPSAGSTGATYTGIDTSSLLSIKSNRYFMDTLAGGNAGGIASGIPGAADYTLSITQKIVTTPSDTSSRMSLYGRYDFAAGNGYELRLNDNLLAIRKVVSGTPSDLDLEFVPGFSQGPIGTVNVMELVFAGSTIQGKWNGTVVCTATDATYGAAGRVGWHFDGFGSATAGQHISALSGVDTTSPAVPAKLGVSSQPTTAITQRVFASNIVIAVQTSGGATVTGDTSNVTLALNVVSGYAAITAGTLTKAAVAGLATFNDIAVTCSDGATWTFTATDGALTSATTATITGQVMSNDTVVTCS